MSNERQEARAEAAAAKARSKAMRPWYKKKRFIIPLALLAIIVISAIAGAGGDDAKKAADTASDAAKGAANGVESHSDNSEHPPQDDVKLTACTVEPTLGLPKASGTLHNASSKTSNYTFHIEFLQGTTRVAEGYDFENEIAAGQDATWDASGDKTDVKGPVTCRITRVERNAA